MTFEDFIKTEKINVNYILFYSDEIISQEDLRNDYLNVINDLENDKEYITLVKDTLIKYQKHKTFFKINTQIEKIAESLISFLENNPQIINQIKLIHIYDNQLEMLEVSFYTSIEGKKIVSERDFTVHAIRLNKKEKVSLLNRLDYLPNMEAIEDYEPHQMNDFEYLYNLGVLGRMLVFRTIAEALNEYLMTFDKFACLNDVKWIVSEYCDELIKVD